MDRTCSLRAAIVVCLLASGPALAADGGIDTSFAADGRQTVPFDLGQADHDRGQAVAGFGDGRLVVAGDVQRNGLGDTDIGVASIEPNGDPDLDFSVDGKAQIFFDLGGAKVDMSHGIAAGLDGRVVACGRANYEAPSSTENRLVVARLLASGVQDVGFGTNGKVVLTPFNHPDSSNTDCRSILSLSDGRVVVPFVNEQYFQTGLIRLEDDGDLDPTFGGDGISELPACSSVVNECRLFEVLLLPDGKYMAIGTKTVQVSAKELVERLFFARYTSGGLLDSSFNGDGQAIAHVPEDAYEHESPMDAALDPLGRVVTLSHATGGGLDDYFLVRIDSDGVVDAAFGLFGWSQIELRNPAAPDQDVTGLLIQGDGRIIVSGHHQVSGSDYDFGLMRLNANATALDATFGAAGRRSIPFDFGTTVETDHCHDLLAVDGRPVAVGQVMVGTSFDFGVARLTNAYIFNDAFESGFSFFWSRTSP